jgi:uncharacterized protein YegL
MPKKGFTDITVLLDRSGSMSSIAKDVSGGLKTLVEDQKKLPGECNFSLVEFDSMGNDSAINWIMESKPLNSVENLPEFSPRGSTPLLDALGDTIARVGTRLRSLPEESRPERVVFVIITDGQENASRKYKLAEIADKIKHQTQVYNWDFLYLGANVDSFAEAGNLGISLRSARNYTPDSKGVLDMYVASNSVLCSVRGGGTADFVDNTTK